MSQTVEIFLSHLLSQLPQLAIATAGLAFVQTRLKGRHPRANLHGNIGFGLLLLASLWTVLSRSYIQVTAAQAKDPILFSSQLTKANMASFVALTVSLVFIAVAVFADRGETRNLRGVA
jgi:hypothetical protein